MLVLKKVDCRDTNRKNLLKALEENNDKSFSGILLDGNYNLFTHDERFIYVDEIKKLETKNGTDEYGEIKNVGTNGTLSINNVALWD